MLTSPADAAITTTNMAAQVENFTLEAVRDFMVSRGGRVTNHDLVKQFKAFLTNPAGKGRKKVMVLVYNEAHRPLFTSSLTCCSQLIWVNIDPFQG